MMLSTLSSSQDVALGGAAAAAQPADAPPPPPYGAAPGAAGGINGELIPFLLWFGLIAVALTISGHSAAPNSPN
jgi:hypothetical protein